MKVTEKKTGSKNLKKLITNYSIIAKWILLTCLSLGHISGYSQDCDDSFYQVEPMSKLECIQGIHSPVDDNNPNSETYLITKGFKVLGLTLKKEGEKRHFYELNIGYEGFYYFNNYVNHAGSYSIVDSFYVCDLKQNGPHYITFLEKHVKPNGWVTLLTTQPEYFCDAGFIESSDRHLTMYEPVLYLPFTAYHHLKEQSQKDNRNYITEFDILNKLKKAEVTAEKAYFYSQPEENTKRKAFVLKGDKVIIDEIREQWIKVAYEGKTTTTQGWLKKSALEILE